MMAMANKRKSAGQIQRTNRFMEHFPFNRFFSSYPTRLFLTSLFCLSWLIRPDEIPNFA